MTKKTLATKLLDGKKIPYDVYEYDATVKDAVEVAAHIGFPTPEVFKTLVVDRTPGKPLLAVVPAPSRLNLKKLAKAAGEKKLKMATLQRAEALTGLRVGGISPLAQVNQGFVVFIDRRAQAFAQIIISAGQRGLQIRLSPDALAKLTGARLADIADE